MQKNKHMQGNDLDTPTGGTCRSLKCGWARGFGFDSVLGTPETLRMVEMSGSAKINPVGMLQQG